MLLVSEQNALNSKYSPFLPNYGIPALPTQARCRIDAIIGPWQDINWDCTGNASQHGNNSPEAHF